MPNTGDIKVRCAKSAKWIALRRHTHNITNGCGSAAPGFCRMATCRREIGPKFGHLWPILISNSLGQEGGHTKNLGTIFNLPRNPGWPKCQFFATPCLVTPCGDNGRMANSPRPRARRGIAITYVMDMSCAVARNRFEDGHK